MVATAQPIDIYGGRDPLDIAAYTIADAAHYLLVPKATLRSWTHGRTYPSKQGKVRAAPLVESAEGGLSFRNLLELHVLAALRRSHSVEMLSVRKAIRFLRDKGVQRPLIDQDILTDGRNIFVETYGGLLSVSEQGQRQMTEVMSQYLSRIERDEAGAPVKFFPFTRRGEAGPQSVEIDPRVQFGRPCLRGAGIPIDCIIDQYLAGDSLEVLASDYGQPQEAIDEAIRYQLSRLAA